MGRFFNEMVKNMPVIPNPMKRGKTLEEARKKFNETIRSTESAEAGSLPTDGEVKTKPVFNVPAVKNRKKPDGRTREGRARKARGI